MSSSTATTIIFISILFLLFESISTSISTVNQDPIHQDQSLIMVNNVVKKITIPMCMDIGYNYTSMPNLLEMETQEEAGLEVHQFWPLVEINCSDDLKFFLCSMYAPICIEEYPGHIPSCKSVCERAKKGCKPIMIQYGFPWPDKMNCSELPVYGDGHQICMDPKKGWRAGIEMDNQHMNNNNGNSPLSNNNNEVKINEDKLNHHHNNKAHNHNHQQPSNNKAKSRNNSGNNNNGNKNHHQQQQPPPPPPSTHYPPSPAPMDNNNNVMIFDTYDDNNGDNNKLSSLNREMKTSINSELSNNNCRCDCRMPYFIRLKGSQTFDDGTYINNGGNEHPHHPHHNHYHSYQQQQQSIHHFNYSKIETASGLAPMCALSCKGAYHFNENEQETAFFWIGITAAICAITCLLTVFTSLTDTERFRYPERAIIFLAACYIFIAGGYLLRIRLGHNAIACDGPFIRYQRTGPTPASCILSFILLYFFGMASAYWWLILTLTWFLAAGLKWSSEAITSYAQYFHLLAWLLPTAQSVTILCLGSIDGDPFMGVCTVGNQSRANLLIFVITPLCVCIAIGILFLFTGFVALFRIRRAIRQTQHTIRVKTDKLEKLMIRIGLSSFLYIVPEVVVVACHIYEYIYRPLWEKSITCLCTSSSRPFGSPNSSRSSGASQLLPNMGNYYGRGITGLSAINGVGGSSLPMKTQTVNLGPTTTTTTTISQPTTPHHHHHHLHNHHNQLHQHVHQQHDMQSRQASLILAPRPPSIPPPLPPPPPSLMAAMANNGHHKHHHGGGVGGGGGGSGSLTGSQFTHMIGSINGTTNSNSKHPLSHV
ncbi:Wnt-activated receptor [Dermatophagoides farinae]|uniref:Wnt-activated receptor n=1 Tax=Dermatophagoides farinae TaxID=6954 RepID=A0A922HQP8_DERFA|nr:Wnt-activated receptor [Dermatophagoides farinae]